MGQDYGKKPNPWGQSQSRGIPVQEVSVSEEIKSALEAIILKEIAEIESAPTLGNDCAFKVVPVCLSFSPLDVLRKPLTPGALKVWARWMVPPQIARNFSLHLDGSTQELDPEVPESVQKWPHAMRMALALDVSATWIAKACEGCPPEDMGIVLTNAVKLICLASFLLEETDEDDYPEPEPQYQELTEKDKADFDDFWDTFPEDLKPTCQNCPWDLPSFEIR